MMRMSAGVALTGSRRNEPSRRSRLLERMLHGPILYAALALCSAAPAADAPELQKPAPDAAVQPSRQRLTALLRERYPQLLAGGLVGTPVLTVLFNADGSVARSNLQVLAQTSGTLTATETRFAGLGVRSGELQYVGEAPVQLPHTRVLVVFGIRSDEVLDRELVERYFPQVLTPGIPGGQRLWILFDHRGKVRKYGAESFQPAELRNTMELRYPGIHIKEATVAPVIGRSGRPVESLQHEALQLNCLWLAVDSPLPPK